MRTLLIAITAALLCGAFGCGSSEPGGSGSGSSTAGTNAGSGSNGSGSVSSTGSTSGSSSSTGSSSTGSGSSGGASTSGSSGSSGSSGETGPITGLPTEQWTWVPFSDAICRDGTPTGIGINLNPASTKLMIFLEGGGACFNNLSCGQNPSHFDESDFNGGSNQSGAIFDRGDASNPVADWSWVYVPYCTGDVHAGNNPDAGVSGVAGHQQFVGYENMRHFLARIAPTFPGTTEVLLAGVSAGGLGVAANYTQVARAFSGVPVHMLDDSGPFMEDPYLPICLQQMTRHLWNLDATVLSDCGADCPDGGDFFMPYARKVIEAYPDARFGLIDSTDDQVMTLFYGFGANNCSAAFPTPVSAAEYDAGLMDIRNQLAGDTNFGSFYVAGNQHTWLESGNFTTQDAGGVLLENWVADLADGGVSNVGP